MILRKNMSRVKWNELARSGVQSQASVMMEVINRIT